MPEATQVVTGVHGMWILKAPIDAAGNKGVWSAYDFNLYLRKSGLNAETIVMNPMTRQRFLQECDHIFRKPGFAVKFLRNPTPAALDKFAREVEALIKLQDPHIVRIFDYSLVIPEVGEGDEDEEKAKDKVPPFYVMEKVNGVSLRDKVEKHKAYAGEVHESLSLMVEMASALAVAHKAGIVHRDLNPGNILILEDGSPVIIDFAVCHIIDGQRHSLAGRESGPLHFVAPELAVGPVNEEDVCPANDIYAFGKLLYYMLSGGKELPREVHHDEEHDLQKKYPSKQMDSVYYILDRTVLGNLKERVQTVQELLEIIKKELAEGSACIFCGEGTYQRLSSALAKEAWDTGRSQALGAYNPRLFVCDKCGNLQYFFDPLILRDNLNR